MHLLSSHHVNRTAPQLAALALLVAVLDVAAVAGMAYVSGFSAVDRLLDHADWWWLLPAAGGMVLAWVGYYYAYCGTQSADHGSKLPGTALLAVSTAAYVGFLAHGETELDRRAMRAAGAGRREAKVRVGALAGFEQGSVALIACPASIAALIVTQSFPRTSFTLPWAVIPAPAFILLIWLAERYRDRLRRYGGWRGGLSAFCDIAHIVYLLMRRHPPAFAGMLLYWGAEMFILGAGLAVFGWHGSVLIVIVSLATAMLFTRRTAPLAGGGVLVLALVPTLWYGGGVPYATAAAATAAYRAISFWLPLAPSLAALPELREVDRAADTHAARSLPQMTSIT